MKCFQCKKEINEGEAYVITSPDGDMFHPDCLTKFEIEKTTFLMKPYIAMKNLITG